MANEYTPDLITLIGDDGKEIEFEILDIIENDEGKFYVLYPFFENPEDAVNDSGEYYIFEVTEIDGEEELAEISALALEIKELSQDTQITELADVIIEKSGSLKD